MIYILEAIGTFTKPLMRWVLTGMSVNAIEIDYTGSKNAQTLIKRAGSAGQASSAQNLVSENKHFSTQQIRGCELAHGTSKITHEHIEGEDDSAASGVSIHLKGANSQAKGIFVKHDGSAGLSHQEVYNAASTPLEGFGWSKNAQELYMRNEAGARVKLTINNLNQLVVSSI